LAAVGRADRAPRPARHLSAGGRARRDGGGRAVRRRARLPGHRRPRRHAADPGTAVAGPRAGVARRPRARHRAHADLRGLRGPPLPDVRLLPGAHLVPGPAGGGAGDRPMSDGTAEQRVEWTAARIAEVTGQPPPTPEQTAVIEAPLEPLLVVAGAGSGKTATMAARVVYLLANRLVEPGEVLGLTFTRKAAAELSERVRHRLREVRAAGAQVEGDERPRVATYNSYAGSIVRDHALR